MRAAPIISLLLVVFCAALNGQPDYRYFYGRVVDRITGSAIANANITLPGTKIGTVSDRRGSFSFFTDTIPVYMLVSHLGYATGRIYLDGTSYSITVEMERMATMLGEVEIRSVNEPEPFYKDNAYSVLDFVTDSTRIYILVYRYRLSSSYVVCRSLEGDTIGISSPLWFRPVRLFTDCLGFVHVLGKDSVFQLGLSGNTVELFYPASVKRFLETLSNCVASTPKLLFFKKLVNQGMSVEFYTVDRSTSKKDLMSVAHDHARSSMLNRNRDDKQLMQMEKPPDSRDNFVQWSYARKILYRPNTTTLHRMKDRICIFNTTDRTIEFYNAAGEFTGKLLLPMNNAMDGKWTQEIYIDEPSASVYTTFAQTGIYTLYQISLHTGDLRRIIAFTHLFPQKIKIHNGFLFYLYDAPDRADNKLLFRQKL